MQDSERRAFVPEVNIPGLRRKIESLDRRAAKLGIPGLRLQVLKNVADMTFPGYDYVVRCREVLVTGEAKVPGWRLAGVIELRGGGNNVITTSGGDLPSSFRHAPDLCQCCGIAAKGRRRLIAVENDVGETKLIGTTCIESYLGPEAGAIILSAAESLAQVPDILAKSAEAPEPGLARPFVTAQDAAAIVIASVAKRGGFVAKAAATHAFPSTAAIAEDALFGKNRHGIVPTATQRRDGDAVVSAMKAFGGSEIMENARAMAADGRVFARDLGVFAFAAAEAHSAIMRSRTATASAGSPPPEPGTKIAISGWVVSARAFEPKGHARAACLAEIAGDDGRVFRWLASRTLEAGEVVCLSGTVREVTDGVIAVGNCRDAKPTPEKMASVRDAIAKACGEWLSAASDLSRLCGEAPKLRDALNVLAGLKAEAAAIGLDPGSPMAEVAGEAALSRRWTAARIAEAESTGDAIGLREWTDKAAAESLKCQSLIWAEASELEAALRPGSAFVSDYALLGLACEREAAAEPAKISRDPLHPLKAARAEAAALGVTSNAMAAGATDWVLASVREESMRRGDPDHRREFGFRFHGAIASAAAGVLEEIAEKTGETTFAVRAVELRELSDHLRDRIGIRDGAGYLEKWTNMADDAENRMLGAKAKAEQLERFMAKAEAMTENGQRRERTLEAEAEQEM